MREDQIEYVNQEDWETGWKAYYHALPIGENLMVCPSWENCETDRKILKLDPGMAFGTGTHETTNLCLEVLDRTIKGGERILDVGTGSGILGIASCILGASEAEGVDIDPTAVKVAMENAQPEVKAAADFITKSNDEDGIVTVIDEFIL